MVVVAYVAVTGDDDADDDDEDGKNFKNDVLCGCNRCLSV